MRASLISATKEAVLRVDAARFFQTERGFHGRFYCALQEQLDRADLIPNGAILEMEYQKSARHRLEQRPDIVFHIPIEHSQSDVQANNFAVWALKRRASPKEARDDFQKLDQMFAPLNYPLGFFINIDSIDTMRQHYTGNHHERLVAVAASLDGDQVSVHWAPKNAERNNSSM